MDTPVMTVNLRYWLHDLTIVNDGEREIQGTPCYQHNLIIMIMKLSMTHELISISLNLKYLERILWIISILMTLDQSSFGLVY